MNLFAAPLLALLLAPSKPVDRPLCAPMPIGTITAGYAEMAGDPIARRPVLASVDAIVAEEWQYVGNPAWRTAGPVSLRPYSFPGGTLVALTRTSEGAFPCVSGSQLVRGRGGIPGTILCLEDRDGDGSHEAALLISMLDGRVRRGALGAPVTLLPVAGAERGPVLVARRRLRIAAVGTGTVRLVVEHGIAAPDAAFAFAEIPGLPRDSALVDGAVAQVGGTAVRLVHAQNGWTLEPLQERFPPWVHYDCDGNATIGEVAG